MKKLSHEVWTARTAVFEGGKESGNEYSFIDPELYFYSHELEVENNQRRHTGHRALLHAGEERSCLPTPIHVSVLTMSDDADGDTLAVRYDFDFVQSP